MQSMLHPYSYFARFKAASIALVAIGGLFFSSCATTSSTEPDPERPSTTTETEAEFYTPGPSGEADDYWLFNEGEDDVEYSYYLDEDHYYYVVNDRDDNDDDEGKKKWKKRFKNGHGYGDDNHIHMHWKDRNPGKRIYIRIRRQHWADSIALTDSQKVLLDSGMKAFKECAKESLDSFKTAFKPYRDEFRAEKMRILSLMTGDSTGISRDSAYVLLDSAIERYETQTQLLKAGLQVELQSCYQELDAYMMSVLDPRQYEIWKRNRGW
jgi:hypothetical protein